MKDQRNQDIARLRFLVGYLGEKDQGDWWSSGFCSPTAPAFLMHAFAKSTTLAQYHGVTEAARRIHDEHIGTGRVFHLFRLPEVMEEDVFSELHQSDIQDLVRQDIQSEESALAALEALADSARDLNEGPVQLGVSSDLDDSQWISSAAGCYLAAFKAGARSYPYFLDRS